MSDPRTPQRVATIATDNDHQTQIQRLMSTPLVRRKRLRGYAEEPDVEGALSEQPPSFPFYDKELAFDVLAACIDVWAKPPVNAVAFEKIVERLAQLRAQLGGES
jgi:hypothetical protein